MIALKIVAQHAGPVLGCLALAACAVPAPNTQQANSLATAVTALTQAETNLYNQIVAIDVASQRAHFAANFVLKTFTPGTDLGELYMAPPPDGWDKVKAIRLKVLAQLNNYAQQLDAVASAGSTGWPAAQAKATETATDNLVKSFAKTSISKGVSNDMSAGESAVNDIGAAIIAAKAATEVTALATQAEPGIEIIQTMINNDNKLINMAIPPIIVAEQHDEGNIIEALYEQNADPLQRFQMVQSFAALPPISTLQAEQAALSDAIGKIVAANQALAAGKTESALDFINQAVASANQAATATK